MKVDILGVNVDNLPFDQLVDEALYLARGKGNYLVTPNPEFVMTAQKDDHFKQVINRASLSIPDGIGVVWAGRLLGYQIPGRVAGADLSESLVARAAREGLTAFLLGGMADTAQLAASRLKERYSGLRVIGAWAGDPRPDSDRETRQKIGSGRIDLLLVAYGHPKQEKWIDRNLPKLNVGLAAGVGGSFDFWSGKTSRAPKFVRSIGLEWLYRLAIQPWRVKRQLALVSFSWLVLKKLLEKVKRPQDAGAESFQNKTFKG